MISRFRTATVLLIWFGFPLVILLSPFTLNAQTCVNIAGPWYGSESGTVTCSGGGESETFPIYGSGNVTIIQNGCNVTYNVPGITASRSGTVSGNSIQVSGPMILPVDSDVIVTQNTYTASGTISADGRSMNLSGSGSAAGIYEGINYTCTGTSQVVFTKALTYYTLTLTKSGGGYGTVTSSPSGISCSAGCSASFPSGTVVTLTATPDAGSSFASWSGCDTVNGNVCTVTMNRTRSATVLFSTFLYADFGSDGTWLWNGSNWNKLTSSDPENMVVAGSLLYVDFGISGGLWLWNGSYWSKLTSSDEENMLAP